MCVCSYVSTLYVYYTYACKRPSGFHGILASHHEEFRPVSCPLSFTSTRKDNVSTGVSCGDAVAIFIFFWDPINSGLYTQLLSHWKWGILQKCKFFSSRGNDHKFEDFWRFPPQFSETHLISWSTSMIFPAGAQPSSASDWT